MLTKKEMRQIVGGEFTLLQIKILCFVKQQNAIRYKPNIYQIQRACNSNYNSVVKALKGLGLDKNIGKKTVENKEVVKEEPKQEVFELIAETPPADKLEIIGEDSQFKEFWDKYNYKKSKPTALRAWDRLNKVEKYKAIESVELFKETVNDKQFLPYPATYLNKKRFNDDLSKLEPKESKRDQKRKDIFNKYQKKAMEGK